MKNIKNFFFRTCPKSGRIIGLNKDRLLLKIFFPLIGIAAIIWFLVRVIPKPSRIEYPCQKVAAPIALSTLSYLAGYLGLVYFFRKTKSLLKQKRFKIAVASIISGLLVSIFVLFQNPIESFAAEFFGQKDFYEPIDKPNQPMGVGKGIFPGRVVWARDTTATRWNGETGHWWDDNSTRQDVVDKMMSTSIQALTGTTNNKKAWEKLFKFHNKTHGRNQGYRKNEIIAVKINCNNAYAGYGDNDQQIDASKQTVLSILRQLVNDAGVPQDRILVYEAVRVIPDRIYVPCHAEFPGVVWMDSKGDPGKNGRIKPVWRPNTLTYSGTTLCGDAIPQQVYDATYLVNLAILKGHVSIGISLTAKNHYGTINKRDHSRFDPGVYHPFVDIIGSKLIGQKTILYMIDGLYGIRDVNDNVSKLYAGWNNLFHGQWLASIFMSQDPIAIDAVGYDFLRSEFGKRLGRGKGMPADTYMHEAALADNPPSGTVYMQDGVRLKSLGVHEHWNNAMDKQYTRNLDPKGKGIELFSVHN